MIHRNDEGVFRFIELTTYVGFIFVVGALRFRRVPSDYFMPVTFFALGFLGIVYMARFFVYAHPERIWDRTRAEVIAVSSRVRILLWIGFAMCLPMLAFGCIGLYSPSLMNRVISAISPFDLASL